MEGCCKTSEWKGAKDGFLAYAQGIGRARETLSCYQTSLNIFLGFLETKRIETLAEATPQVLGEFQSWLYRRKTRFGKRHTLEGQIHVLCNVKVFFRYLHVSGKLLSDPSECLQLPKQAKRLPGQLLSAREVKKLLAQPDTLTLLGFRDRTMYEVLYSTGLRVSELIRFRVRDVAKTSLFIEQSKHYKDRYVPLGKMAQAYLDEYLSAVRPLMLRAATSRPGETVFLNCYGNPLSPSGVEAKLKVYARRAKLNKRLTIHVFRHTLATEMLRAGADLRQIQELLGHKRLKSTQLYTHVVKGELKRVQSHCHPREQSDLPKGFAKYRGFGR